MTGLVVKDMVRPMPRPRKQPAEIPAMCLRLKAIRDVLDFTQVQMAEVLEAGYQGKYKTYENRTRPTREIVAMVERQLGVPSAALLDNGGVDDEQFQEQLAQLRERAPRIRQIFGMVRAERAERAALGNLSQPSTTHDNETNVLLKQLLEAILRLDAKIEAAGEPESDAPPSGKGKRS